MGTDRGGPHRRPGGPVDYDSYATENYGVAAGHWTAIVAEWNARMRGGDWRVGAAFGEAFEAAQKQLKQEKKEKRG